MATNDRPASPEVKLYVRLELAQKQGKAFDEALERRLLGLPPAKGREPVAVEEAPARTASTLRADAVDALAQIKVEAQAGGEEDLRKENALLKAQLAAAQGQVAEVTGATPPVPVPQPAAPSSSPTADMTAFPAGVPSEAWTATQLREFNRASGLAPLTRGGVGLSKRFILDHVLSELEKAAAAEDVLEGIGTFAGNPPGVLTVFTEAQP